MNMAADARESPCTSMCKNEWSLEESGQVKNVV